MNNAGRMRKKGVPQSERELLWQEQLKKIDIPTGSCYAVAVPHRTDQPLPSIRGLKAVSKSCAILFPLSLPSQRMYGWFFCMLPVKDLRLNPGASAR